MTGHEILLAAIAEGLRSVVLPDKLPVKVGLVIAYDESTVRHEISPREGNAK